MTTKRGPGNISDAPSIKKRKDILKRIDKMVKESNCKNGVKLYHRIRREIAYSINSTDGHVSQCFQFTRDGSAVFWEKVDDAITEMIVKDLVKWFIRKYDL